MRTPHVIVASLAAALLLGAAPDTDQPSSRYTMTPAEGGAFLRLDTHTGAVSACQRKDGRWVCEAVADDRRALETELDRLATENKELKGTVKQLEELLTQPDPGGGDRRAHRGGPRLQLPSEEDVDKAMDYIQRMMRKFKERMRDLSEGDRRSL